MINELVITNKIVVELGRTEVCAPSNNGFYKLSLYYIFLLNLAKIRTSSMGWEYHWDSVAIPPWVLDDILKIIKPIYLDKKHNYSNDFFLKI